jgi:Skp family chaperone for outer membrane proteins
MDREKGGQLSQKRNDKLREILLDVEKVVSGIADKEGFDYVLNNETLIFANKANNLTDRVLKSLNDNYKK